MDKIRDYFEKIANLNDKDWQIFSSKLISREFFKKAMLLRPGQTESHLSFVERGIIRYFIPREEKDLTFGFAFDNSFICAYDSFLTQVPSTYQLQALTHTILWSITYRDLQEIYNKTEIGNTIGRFAAEDLFLKKNKRELSLLNETAEQRYVKLFAERPELFKQIPLKYIASYVGITPQALSRIRKRIS